VFHAPWIYTLLAPAVRSARLPAILIHYDPADGRRWIDRLLSPRKPSLAIAVSRAAAASLPKLFSDVRCETIYVPAELPDRIALSVAERDAERAGLSTAPDATVILQVGRMEPYKGHRINFQALVKLAELTNLVCWFAGRADLDYEQRYLDSLKAEAARLGIADRVRFIGYYEDLPRLLAAADIYCQPNTGPEGFGLTFIEALWARLPVIGTPMSGVVDILDDECAIIVPPGDSEAVANAIRKLAGDPDLRARMGSAGPARAAQCCDVERQVRRLGDAILTAVADATRT
jgi:glycosyltransferase involved in cell wall biosynthesis